MKQRRASRATPRASARPRLDVWLVDNALADSREKAQALVMAGRVRVDGQPAAKPGAPVRPGSAVDVMAGPDHVGRGAVKLAGALEAFQLDPAGCVAVDVGASTGGFTETLLARGARRVYAVDVGRAQLHEKLRCDPRVVVLERVNARALSANQIPELCGFATLDVSFISALKILPALLSVLAPGAPAVILVKPQFEVGRRKVGRGGIVSEPALHREAVSGVARGALAAGYSVVGACASPITGAEGNREFFLHLVASGPRLSAQQFDAMMARAVGPA